MWIAIDQMNQLSLVIDVDDPSDGTGGTVALNLQWLSLDTTQTFLLVQDDPTTISGTTADFADSYVYTNGGASFSWNWGPTTGDGAVIGPLQPFGANAGFCIKLSVVSSVNISNWQFAYPNKVRRASSSSLVGWCCF